MTRRTVFTGSSSGRRRERRAALQNEITASAERLHRPTLSRAQIQAKGTHHTPDRIEHATCLKMVAQDANWERREYLAQIERASVLYENELRKPTERKNHRIWYSKPTHEMGVTCTGTQRIKGKSIPLI